jgi:hypothetical protein
MFKLTGTLKVINPTQVISDRFSKREFVVETQDQYPQMIMFQATQDKCGLLDNFQMNEQVEVSFNLRGREWTSPQGEVKYFNTIEAWRIERVGQPAGMPAGGPSAMDLGATPTTAGNPTMNMVSNNDDSDDLPF